MSEIPTLNVLRACEWKHLQMFEIATGDIDAAGFAQVMSHHQPN
jgi:hypothetical protein